jgi:hypothetical protein
MLNFLSFYALMAIATAALYILLTRTMPFTFSRAMLFDPSGREPDRWKQEGPKACRRYLLTDVKFGWLCVLWPVFLIFMAVRMIFLGFAAFTRLLSSRDSGLRKILFRLAGFTD